MRKIALISLALSALLALAGAASAAGEVVVIANPGLALGPGDIIEVFLGDKRFAGDVKLVPVDNASAQEQFLARYLKLDPDKYSTAWIKKSFRDGVNAPAVKATDAEVVDFVRKTKGAVGYVKGGARDGVKVVDAK
jgi:hypothetical protein